MRLDLHCQQCGKDFWVVKPLSKKTRCSKCYSTFWNGGKSQRAKTVAERFWEKVAKSDGCWEWTAHKTPGGYGRMGIGPVLGHAHRISWEINRGPIPQEIHVLHHCDNPGCVRPDHLFLGTNQDNINDRIKKGRTRKDFFKLKPEYIPQIKEMRASGALLREIGDRFGVHPATIGCLLRGVTWRSA